MINKDSIDIWANSKLRRQKDVFTKEEKLKIFEMMQKEFNLN